MTPERWELARGERDYPDCLEQTPRPPEKLYGYGDPSLLRPGLGAIGARKGTPYGLKCADLFVGWAASKGAVVVSGAAIGCDQACHRAALKAGGRTVAVLGCGADLDYPSNAGELLAVLRRDGAVVSELPWGAPPAKWTFLERNRIIAGLSAVLLVVEAAVRSGTFTTADAALDASRTVLAVPGSVFAHECRGTNRLIRQGAHPLTDISELADELRAAGVIVPPVEWSDPPGTGDDLLALLLADPMRPDDVVFKLGIDIIEAVRRMSMLETEGLIKRYADGRFGPGDAKERR